jgi:hypothetical protein
MVLSKTFAISILGIAIALSSGCNNKKNQGTFNARSSLLRNNKNNQFLMQQMKYRQQQRRQEAELQARDAKLAMVAGFIKSIENEKNQNIALMVSGLQSVTDSANKATGAMNGTDYHPVAPPKPGARSVVDGNTYANAYIEAKAAGAEITQTRAKDGTETMIIRQNGQTTCVVSTTQELADETLAPYGVAGRK